VEVAANQEVGSGFWYNVPQIDLTVGYAIHSLDRNFADERRRERGHSPEVQLSLEMPLDFYRSARAFQRQVDARHERRRLSMLVAQRRWQTALRDIELAIAEARAALSVAEAEEALQREDVRITRLRIAAGEIDESQSADVALIQAELQALEAEIRLTEARSELARNLFARELAAGNDVKLLAAALAPTSQLARSSGSRRP
jgi:outer membrane protein TolC